MATAANLQAIATELNERQRAYLLAAYDEDQAREAIHRGAGSPPALALDRVRVRRGAIG